MGEDWEWGYQHTVQYRNMLCFCRPQWCTISGSTAGNDAWFWGHQQITSDSTRTVHCHWPHQVLTAGGTCFSQRGPYSQAGTNCHLNSECKKALSVSFVQTVNDSEYIFSFVCLFLFVCFFLFVFLYIFSTIIKSCGLNFCRYFGAQIFGTHFVLWGPIYKVFYRLRNSVPRYLQFRMQFSITCMFYKVSQSLLESLQFFLYNVRTIYDYILHSLQQHLQVNAGETNLALNRGQRRYDAQEKAQGYLLVCN